jgi:hypothetical protein
LEIDIGVLFELLKESTVVRVALLSGAVTTIVSYIKRIIQRKFPDTDFWYVPLIALAIGEITAFIYQLNLFESLGDTSAQIAAGIAMTGVMVGGGAQLFYVVLSRGKAILDAIKKALERKPLDFDEWPEDYVVSYEGDVARE